MHLQHLTHKGIIFGILLVGVTVLPEESYAASSNNWSPWESLWLDNPMFWGMPGSRDYYSGSGNRRWRGDRDDYYDDSRYRGYYGDYPSWDGGDRYYDRGWNNYGDDWDRRGYDYGYRNYGQEAPYRDRDRQRPYGYSENPWSSPWSGNSSGAPQDRSGETWGNSTDRPQWNNSWRR
ncbi:hypothetical protein CCP3SC1AL1_50034 [Gammaproteobacteria bacterium]